jgi:anthranilate phosphoribosyltransferase
MIKEAISKLVSGENLKETEAFEAMEEIMSGRASKAQIGGFLTALAMKGETVEEITGCARAMRKASLTIGPFDSPLVDTCGTGADRKGTFNISTASAFVTAAAGIKVAKHGNRSVTSRCGSADLLEALGLSLEVPPQLVQRSISELGIGFLFAPAFHPAMKRAAAPRRELGFRTIFNLLGPLTNPAGAKAQVVGVFDGRWVEPLAHVLMRLGVERALVVHGSDGLDEITLFGPTSVAELKDAQVTCYELVPEALGLKTCSEPEAIEGGDVARNVAIFRSVLAGEPGPCRDIVLANAAAAIYCGGGASSLAEGLERAAEAIDSGRAAHLVERLVSFSSQ